MRLTHSEVFSLANSTKVTILYLWNDRYLFYTDPFNICRYKTIRRQKINRQLRKWCDVGNDGKFVNGASCIYTTDENYKKEYERLIKSGYNKLETTLADLIRNGFWVG
jgi:hypothetical protein